MSRKKIYFFSAIGVILAAAILLRFGTEREIWIVIDGVKQPARVHAWTVGGALADAGIAVNDLDILQPPQNAWLSMEGTQIQITHARSVNILELADGTPHVFVSATLNVADLLAEAGVRLNSANRLWVNGARVNYPEKELPPGVPVSLVIRRAQMIGLQIGKEKKADLFQRGHTG